MTFVCIIKVVSPLSSNFTRTCMFGTVLFFLGYFVVVDLVLKCFGVMFQIFLNGVLFVLMMSLLLVLLMQVVPSCQRT